VATIGAVSRQFGRRVLAIYLGTIIVGSMLGAIAFDTLLSGIATQTAPAHQHETHSWWAQASGLVLLALFAWFAVADAHRWWRRRRAGTAAPQDEQRIAVQGLRCANCVAHVERALQAVAGVQSCIVRLEPGEAIVRGKVDADRIRQAIREAGYQAE
jgi:copper chaperone CopZ